jgi:hypothetical protein
VPIEAKRSFVSPKSRTVETYLSIIPADNSGDQPKLPVPIISLLSSGQRIFSHSMLTTPTYIFLFLQPSPMKTKTIPLCLITSTSHSRTSRGHRVPLSPQQHLRHQHHRVLPATPRRRHPRSLCLHMVRVTTHFPWAWGSESASR